MSNTPSQAEVVRLFRDSQLRSDRRRLAVAQRQIYGSRAWVIPFLMFALTAFVLMLPR